MDGVRINKYLADRGDATRKGADELVRRGVVYINGRRAALGDKVMEGDEVVVRQKKKPTYTYLAYNKPIGVETQSPVDGLFPIGRLDKKSKGLLILTDDGRITDRLLNPDRVHDKEYKVRTRQPLPNNFKRRMEGGVAIDDYVTRECEVEVTGDHSFIITLTEGKNHQIRRMCATLRLDVTELERTRILNIRTGRLKSGETRPIKGAELDTFLAAIGLA